MDEHMSQVAEGLRAGASALEVSISPELIRLSRQRGHRRMRRRLATRVAAAAAVVLAGGAAVGMVAGSSDGGSRRLVTTGGAGPSPVPGRTVPSTGGGSPGPVTTVSPPAPVDPASVTTSFQAPGPAGTTLSLVVSPGTGDAQGDVCYRVTTSDPGEATFAGKPPFQPISTCAAAIDIHPINSPVGTVGGELYRSRTGAAYMIVVGQARDASTVTYTFAPQDAITAKVVNGWYLMAVPYTQFVNGYSVTAYDAGGRVTGTGGAPGQPAGVP